MLQGWSNGRRLPRLVFLFVREKWIFLCPRVHRCRIWLTCFYNVGLCCRDENTDSDEASLTFLYYLPKASYR